MQESLKEELIELGKQLKELAIRYHEDYLTINYVDGAVLGNNSTSLPKEKRISIWIGEEENE